MTSNVRMILDEVSARIKLAEAKMAEDPSNFDSFPGAENDKDVAEECKKPDPEVKEEGPASRTEATGAEAGSDDKVNQDHLYEADEPVLTPTKKPEESADANAKEASANPEVTKVAADILSVIKGALAKKAACNDASCEKKTEAKEEPKAEDKTAEKKEEKKAEKADTSMELGSRILDKIASIRMAKEAGAKDAMNLIKAAQDYNRGAADAKALIEKIAQALEESAESADDAAVADNQAGADEAAAAEAAGAADAEAALADAAAADAAGGVDDVTPEEVVQAVDELVSEGQISQEDAATLIAQLGADEGAGEDVTDEQIAEGLAQAIQNGEITEDEAQQLVSELVAAGADPEVKDEVAEAGAEAAGADEAAAAEAAGAADAEAALADAQKQAEAMAKQASDAQVERYQRGFIQKCAEYGADPQKVAQYLQARIAGQL